MVSDTFCKNQFPCLFQLPEADCVSWIMSPSLSSRPITQPRLLLSSPLSLTLTFLRPFYKDQLHCVQLDNPQSDLQFLLPWRVTSSHVLGILDIDIFRGISLSTQVVCYKMTLLNNLSENCYITSKVRLEIGVTELGIKRLRLLQCLLLACMWPN